MQVLGIDYGRKKIGLAIGNTEARLVEPLRVVRFESSDEAIEQVSKVLKEVDASTIVLGVSEGEMGKETKAFGKKLEKNLNIQVIFQDETLTTHEAQRLAINAGIKRKKRKDLEDAYSATLILQDYLNLL